MESLEENPWSDEDRVSHKPPPRCVHHSREALKSLRHLAGSSSQAPNSLLRESFVAQAETLKLVDPKRNLAKFVHSRKESLSNPVLRPTASEKISTASSRQPSNAHHDVKATNKENQANTPRASEETRQERSFSYASVTMLQTTQVREKVSKTTSNSSRSPATLETTAPTNKVFPSQARAHDPSPLEEQFFRWRRDVPRDNAMAYKPLSRYLLGQFFQQGLALVRSEHDTMQRVITLLAQEGGLRRIDEVVSAIPSVSISFQKKFFTEVVLPFLQTVSHERVLASAVLEAPLTKIMQFVYGPNGHRAIEFFTIIFALPKPSALDPPGLDLGDAAAAVLYEPSILVLSKIIDLNGGALINEEIHQLVESICKKINETGDDLTLLTVRKYLQRIRRRLDRVTSNDSDKRHHKISPSPAPKFHIAEERPGKLSDQGPRHDNDSENICDIKIMPTSQEIQSEREEYLPTRDPSTWHLRGLPGLLDRHFRLLREDTVGQLRDAVSAEFKRMQNPEAAQPRASKQMLRTITYHNVRYMQLLCDRRGGLRFVIQFDQPAPIKLLSSNAKRKDWWQAARRLQRDVLVCLIDSDGSAIFCYVSGLYRTQPQRGGLIHSRAFEENIGELSRDQDFGYVTLSPVQQDAESLKEILARFRGSPIYKMESLVEFPGVLLPSFQSTLVALQDMAKTLELPFADVLAPESVEASGNQWIDPPSYSLKKKFKFNLRSITEGERLMLPTDGSPFDFEKLRDHSSLDDAQATALVDALTRSLALIQGPPGTGKSYTGVAIIKVLLDNRAKAKLGPVICVCYTNHALDQLLNQLIESGVENVVRIGSQSKSSVLDSVNLRAIAEKMSRTRTENKQKFTTTSALLSDISELNQCIEDLSKVQHWATIKDFLSSTYPKHHDDLFGENDNEWQTVRSHPNQIISTWLDGGIPNQTGIFTSTFRSLEDLRAVKLHLMSKPERQSLLSAWISEIREDVEARIQDAYATYLEDKEEHDKIMTDINLRCLQNAHIIGVTSTGLAKNLDLLRRLSSKVIICEEAGEVLEAHTLTTLLPSIEHAILIGDHQQLRPKIDNWELNSENPRGEQYSLDMSLFERLVNPPMPSIQLPFSSLEVQRRMHPSISRLIRQNLYPHLKDSGAVQNYPAVAGMKKRLFWFHHQQLEAPQDPTRLGSASHYNQFELDFTAALVSHLVRQGIYEEGDIAILTPYLGQLMRLRKKLSTSHEIVIGERDAEELEQAGLDEMDERIPQEKPIQKTTLLKALRVSTVDNFQGEEAKVVVISLVRSNKQQQCGFLRTPNRINVLLSRAKHGMYIIGNADTSYKVQMWANVVKMLEQTGNFGEHLELFCPRHPRSVIRVAKAEDFHSKAPEGGCDQPCGKRLKCGHACKQSCHSDLLHSAVYCIEPCTRPMMKCEHACPKLCGDPCPERCQETVRDIELACGHVQNVPCWQAKNKKSILCNKMVEKVVPGCEHTVKVNCAVDAAAASFKCIAVCQKERGCGHKCKKVCHQCNERSGSSIAHENHGVCQQMCGQKYSTCQHSCMMTCHEGEPCRPCIKVCENGCTHSKCGNRCGEPCIPCSEPKCSSACSHGNQCTLPCAAPCDWLPCEKRCEKMLSCGHCCPTVCGEQCPNGRYCQTCAPDEVRELVVDPWAFQKYKDVDLDRNPVVVPGCGHVQTVESLDVFMEMTSYYNLENDGKVVQLKSSSQPFSSGEMKVCPICSASLRDSARYGRIVRRAILDTSTRKLLLWAYKTYHPLAQQMDAVEQDLVTSRELFVPDSTPPHLRLQEVRIEGSRSKYLETIRTFSIYRNRHASILALRNGINLFSHKIREEEQPFIRLFELVRERNSSDDTAKAEVRDTSIVQTRGHLLAFSLLIRCDLAILTDFLALKRREVPQQKIHVDLSMDRKECQEFISLAGAREQPLHVVEGHVYMAWYAALEVAFTADSQKGSDLLDQADYHLSYAQATTEVYPDQTEGMQRVIEGVKKLLDDRKKLEYYVCATERQILLASLATEFSTTGKWYTCTRGHPFTIEGDASKLRESGCPQCSGKVIMQGRMHDDNVSQTADFAAGGVLR